MNKTTSVISCIASFASILSLAFIEGIHLYARIAITCFSFLCMFFLLYSAIRNSVRNERICKNTKEINAAMRELVGSEGQVCVVSGSLSWVDEDTEKIIIEKKDSILIFIENESVLSEKLINQGVRIKYYGSYNLKLRSRFTVIRYNRDNPQVAIATTTNSIWRKSSIRHIIYQTDDESFCYDHWINSLSVDMIEILNIICERGRKSVSKKNSTTI